MFNIKFFNKMALLSMIQDNNGVGGLNCKLNEFRCHTADQNIGDLHFVFSTIETETACMEPVRLVYLLFYHVMLGNPRLSSILDSSLWTRDSKYWIPD